MCRDGRCSRSRSASTWRSWPAYRLRYGFGINDERSFGEASRAHYTPGIVGELTRRNLFGRALAAGRLDAPRTRPTDRPDVHRRSFAVRPPDFVERLCVTLAQADRREHATSGTIRVTQLVARAAVQPAGAHAGVLRLQLTSATQATPDEFDPNVDFELVSTIGLLAASVAYDARDDPFDATRGWFHGSAVEYSAERLGSVLRFLKYLGQVYAYRPLGPVVLASAVRLGVADAFGQVLIPSERFFAGGGNSVRGYDEDAIGPSDLCSVRSAATPCWC